MAFMMPVVKNDWDIYKCNRSRKTSESPPSITSRSRKISECISEGKGSLMSASAKRVVPLPKPHSVPERMASRQYSRQRTSSDTLPNRAKVSIPPERTVSASATNLKGSHSWLDKLKRFMKNKSEDERAKS